MVIGDMFQSSSGACAASIAHVRAENRIFSVVGEQLYREHANTDVRVTPGGEGRVSAPTSVIPE